MVDDAARLERENLIASWQASSLEDFQVANELFSSKHYGYALFYCQLALEKSLKAVFLKNSDSYPIPTHNLVFLAKKAKIPLGSDDMIILKEITTFNIEARYDVLKSKLYRKANVSFALQYIEISKKYLDRFLALL